MKTYTKYFGLLFFALFIFSCREQPTPPPDKPPYVPPIVLTAEDVGVTDAFIRVRFVDTTLSRQFKLTRDGQTILTTHYSPRDTLIVDEGLLPNRQYTYKAYRLLNNISVDSSAPLLITTMDTTSHNFTWQIDTLGDGASSVLRDVAIINDTCVWAVGEIYKKDSLGNWDNEPYGAARWDGKKWHLIKVSYRDFGSPAIWPGRLKAVYGFSPDNIYVASSANLLRWNGTSWQEKAFFMTDISWNGRVNKIWGTSDNNLYLGGDNGAIYFFNGNTWRRLESGTELDVYDIFGATNRRNGETEIYAVAAKQFVTFDKHILKVTPFGVSAVSDSNIPSSLHGVWFKAGGPYYVVGSGMYRKRDIKKTGPWQWLHPGVTQYYTYAICGNDINDVFVCGAFGELLHFNGMTWYSYRNITAITLGAYYGISSKNNLIIAVGQESPRGVIAIGRRNVQ